MKEIKAPDGYVLKKEVTEYFRIDAGTITWIEWQEAEPAVETEADPEAESSAAGETGAASETGADQETVSGWVTKSSEDMVSYSNASFTVENTPGAALPSTGGPGDGLYYFIGLMMAIVAGTGFFLKRTENASV